MASQSRILMAMDLSPMDERLMKALYCYHRFLHVHKTYFLHVMPSFNLPKEVEVEFHSLFSTEYPVDEKVNDKINLDLTEVFGSEPPFETHIDVREGQPLQKLLHWIKVKEIDWLLMGHKKQSDGSGITARRVARQSNCNVFFVPDDSLRATKNILIPIDFSENSARAIRTAYNWKLQDPDVNIQCLYVIDLPPSDYYLRPVPRSGFQAILRTSAEQAFERFVKKYELSHIPVDMIYQENTYSNIANHIFEYIKTNKADLLMLGAQGHSALNNFIFGSVTERLVERCVEIPVVVIR
jgi:nucleotide-binding universal stress UspA family protein